MFLEGLTMLGFDNNGNNSAQQSSPDEESNDSSDSFSTNKQNIGKKMIQNVVFRVQIAPERRLNKVT